MRNVLCCVTGLLAITIAPAARAQGADAGMDYSQGVHAYFAGRSAEAERYLTSALAIDAQDPRAYYFRGLARLRQGRRDDARADMQTGAALEAGQPNRFAIGMALERVQGADRLLLEQHRSAGRSAESNRRGELNRRLYGQGSHIAAEDLYRKATIPLDQLMQIGASGPVVVLERNPQPQPAWAGVVARPLVTASATGGPDDPFPDDPLPPASATPQARPSAGPVMSPAASPTATTPAAVGADENPFGEPAPVGPAARPQAAPAARPAQTPPAENPFGGG